MAVLTLEEVLHLAWQQMDQGSPDSVANLCEAVLARVPEQEHALCLLAWAYLAQGRSREGEAVLLRALAVTSGNEVLWDGVVKGLRQVGKAEWAFAIGGRVLERFASLVSLRRTVCTIGMEISAHAAVERLVAAAPVEDDALNVILSNIRFRSGDWAEGFRLYEHRWGAFGVTPPQPQWDGGRDDGGTLMIYDEQGLGDAIQFLRFVPQARRMFGGKVVLRVLDPLVPLFRGAADEVISREAAIPADAVYAPLMSLPRIFLSRGKTPDIGMASPYLCAEPALVQKVAGKLDDGDRRPRVGITWQGGTNQLPFPLLEPCLGLSQIHWIGLQYNAGAVGDARIQSMMAEDGSFPETAAVMACLDLVIAVDTSMLHLAGALGRPAWGLLNSPSCWRWLDQGTTSPWYPSIKLYRQNAPGDWAGMIRRVAHDLASWAAAQG